MAEAARPQASGYDRSYGKSYGESGRQGRWSATSGSAATRASGWSEDPNRPLPSGEEPASGGSTACPDGPSTDDSPSASGLTDLIP